MIEIYPSDRIFSDRAQALPILCEVRYQNRWLLLEGKESIPPYSHVQLTFRLRGVPGVEKHGLDGIAGQPVILVSVEKVFEWRHAEVLVDPTWTPEPPRDQTASLPVIPRGAERSPNAPDDAA